MLPINYKQNTRGIKTNMLIDKNSSLEKLTIKALLER